MECSVVNSALQSDESHSARSSSLEKYGARAYAEDGTRRTHPVYRDPGYRSRSTVCEEESKRSPDFGATKCTVHSLSVIFCAQRDRPRRENWLKWKEINAEGNKRKSERGVEKREYMRRDRGRIFTIVALRTESHLKSTQFFAIARTPLTRDYSMCVFSLEDPRLFARTLQAATFLSCATFDKRYIYNTRTGGYTRYSYIYDSLIYEARARCTNPACLSTYAYELRRFLTRGREPSRARRKLIHQRSALQMFPGDAMQRAVHTSEIDSLSFISLLCDPILARTTNPHVASIDLIQRIYIYVWVTIIDRSPGFDRRRCRVFRLLGVYPTRLLEIA